MPCKRGIVLTDADIGNIPSVTFDDHHRRSGCAAPAPARCSWPTSPIPPIPTGKTADTDSATGLANTDARRTAANYDNELLDAHFVAGDGRVNENIVLSVDPRGFPRRAQPAGHRRSRK